MYVGKNPDYYGTLAMSFHAHRRSDAGDVVSEYETVRMTGFWLSNGMETYAFPSKDSITKRSHEMMSPMTTNLADVCNSEEDEREPTSPEEDI